jgi:hypothetical protein
MRIVSIAFKEFGSTRYYSAPVKSRRRRGFHSRHSSEGWNPVFAFEARLKRRSNSEELDSSLRWNDERENKAKRWWWAEAFDIAGFAANSSGSGCEPVDDASQRFFFAPSEMQNP